MPASADIAEGIAEAFNVLSEEFLEDVDITLLKVSDTANEFEEVAPVIINRFFEYSNYRKNFLLEIADPDALMTEEIQAATHIQVDDDIYSINSGDTVVPKSTDVTWKLFCDLYERRARYTDLRG